MQIAQLLLFALLGYAVLGLLFAIPFVLRGVKDVDPSARAGAPWGFRLLILPGAAALWPVLLVRWRRAGLVEAQTKGRP